jgi:hypothetical protein
VDSAARPPTCGPELVNAGIATGSGPGVQVAAQLEDHASGPGPEGHAAVPSPPSGRTVPPCYSGGAALGPGPPGGRPPSLRSEPGPATVTVTVAAARARARLVGHQAAARRRRGFCAHWQWAGTCQPAAGSDLPHSRRRRHLPAGATRAGSGSAAPWRDLLPEGPGLGPGPPPGAQAGERRHWHERSTENAATCQ